MVTRWPKRVTLLKEIRKKGSGNFGCRYLRSETFASSLEQEEQSVTLLGHRQIEDSWKIFHRSFSLTIIFQVVHLVTNRRTNLTLYSKLQPQFSY